MLALKKELDRLIGCFSQSVRLLFIGLLQGFILRFRSLISACRGVGIFLQDKDVSSRNRVDFLLFRAHIGRYVGKGIGGALHIKNWGFERMFVQVMFSHVNLIFRSHRTDDTFILSILLYNKVFPFNSKASFVNLFLLVLNYNSTQLVSHYFIFF